MSFESYCLCQCHRVALRLLRIGYRLAGRRIVAERAMVAAALLDARLRPNLITDKREW